MALNSILFKSILCCVLATYSPSLRYISLIVLKIWENLSKQKNVWLKKPPNPMVLKLSHIARKHLLCKYQGSSQIVLAFASFAEQSSVNVWMIPSYTCQLFTDLGLRSGVGKHYINFKLVSMTTSWAYYYLFICFLAISLAVAANTDSDLDTSNPSSLLKHSRYDVERQIFEL